MSNKKKDIICLAYWRNPSMRITVLLDLQGGGSGGTPRKIGWDCVAHFPKPLPYLWPKSAISPPLFMTWPKTRYPIYGHCSWHSCPKHNVWRAFVDGLIDNDEKVASSIENSVQKSDQNGQNRYPIYDQDGWKTIPFGATHTYIAHRREYPLPLG